MNMVCFFVNMDCLEHVHTACFFGYMSLLHVLNFYLINLLHSGELNSDDILLDWLK